MKIYIAGGMSGLPDHNYPAFDKARDDLVWGGNEVVSSPDINRALGFCTYEEYLRRDILAMLECNAVYMLQGWQNSNGARLEFAVAQACGLQVFYEKQGAT